ncbi:MAG: indolepyruvate oxidoreductase subunit beta [Bacteroidales bacterium]|jgi:indolepyruvate ferredoxin oxidoreductase beta subunit|nr:indolepyruvate oxidoreductase subunit beta [Bacteroidales bacterium]
MKTDIILAGVGGQGILSIATVIGLAAINNDLHIKQAEVHGMSQRGGAVYSNLRLSSDPIASDLIPLGKADVIISVEPMESLRYLPYLSPDGWLVTNLHPFININNYPELQSVVDQLNALPNHVLVDADAIASECGHSKASNMVMLGAAVPFLNMALEDISTSVRQIFERKGAEVVNMNIQALNAGYEAAKEQTTVAI